MDFCFPCPEKVLKKNAGIALALLGYDIVTDESDDLIVIDLIYCLI